MSWIAVPLLIISMALAWAVLVLFIEVMAAVFDRGKVIGFDGERPRVLVLIPAHNESRSIAPTIFDIKSQLRSGDRLLVVADNCTDNTAEIALAAKAEVVARHDDTRRGKGFALDFGFRSLSETDPDIVIVIDADCRVGRGAIDLLACACHQTNRPIQASYLMRTPAASMMINHQIAEFAWRVKNDLRPRGLLALGLPCQLVGSGMAFPRAAVSGINLASGHLAEDLELGLVLASSGTAPMFCPAAQVSSEFPSTAEASRFQRQRWEHGHLSILVRRVCPSIWSAISRRDLALLALSADAAVPPVVLLAFLIVITSLGNAVVSWLGGGSAPLVVSLGAALVLAGTLLVAWSACGRDLITWAGLRSIGPYLTAKVGIYARAFAREKKWVRTDRE
jgi:cellulose synthase/poly-beta-1,6-N-acetylglucosamine synthase-like glycosyltransferase